jgi:hypothetical protein
MLEISLSPSEKELIRLWITNLRERSGHWGDGMATFPDEEIVFGKLDATSVKVRMTRFHWELILEWAESSHQNVVMTPPEIMLIEKLQNVLKEEAPEKSP